MVIIISGKIDLKKRNIPRDKEIYLMISRNISTSTFNEYIFNNRAPKHMKQKLTSSKGKTDNFTIIPVDFNILPSITDRTPRGKDKKDKNNTMNKNDLTFIEHPAQQQNMHRF